MIRLIHIRFKFNFKLNLNVIMAQVSGVSNEEEFKIKFKLGLILISGTSQWGQYQEERLAAKELVSPSPNSPGLLSPSFS